MITPLLLNPFPNKPWFLTYPLYKSFENTKRNTEIAHNRQFLLSPQGFLPVWHFSAIFMKFKIFVCKLCQFGRVLNFFHLGKSQIVHPTYLHRESVVLMLFFDLVFILLSTYAFIHLFWNNIDDYPLPFQMTQNGNISIDCQ